MGTTSHHRNNQLAMIHIAKKDLGLDDDTYRGVLRLISNGRTDSSRELDYGERKKLLEHFEGRGWKNSKTARPAAPANTQALVKKVGALLADMKLSWSYADGIAKRMYNRDRLQWCDADELRGVITALIKKRGIAE